MDSKEIKINKLQNQIDSGKLPENIKQKFIEQIKYLKNDFSDLKSFIGWLIYPNFKQLIYLDRVNKNNVLIKPISSRKYPLEDGDENIGFNQIVQIYPENNNE